jgi:hypothetical protein
LQLVYKLFSSGFKWRNRLSLQSGALWDCSTKTQ